MAGGECEYFMNPNDMGDPGGCAEPFHSEDHWREYCDVLGGRQARPTAAFFCLISDRIRSIIPPHGPPRHPQCVFNL